MSEIAQELDRLVGRLEALAGGGVEGPPDAITSERTSAARRTAVQSLREAPEVVAFRGELLDGLIRTDTANRLLRLVSLLIERLM